MAASQPPPPADAGGAKRLAENKPQGEAQPRQRTARAASAASVVTGTGAGTGDGSLAAGSAKRVLLGATTALPLTAGGWYV